MSEPAWIAGDHWCICDVCGFRVRRSATKMRWDNLLVCTEDWEPRHPQERVRGRTDKQRVMNPRPEQPDRFLSVGEVTADDL